jgi:hypothetical protein
MLGAVLFAFLGRGDFSLRRFAESFEWIPPSGYHVVIVTGLMGLFVTALWVAAPILAVRPYLRYKRRHENLVAVRIRPEGLVALARDGSQQRYAWGELVSYSRGGRLVFKGSPRRVIWISQNTKPAWRLLFGWLKRTQGDLLFEPSTPGQYKRVLVTLAVSAILAEAYLAYATTSLGVEPLPRGAILGAAAVLALIFPLVTWQERRLQRMCRRKVFRRSATVGHRKHLRNRDRTPRMLD